MIAEFPITILYTQIVVHLPNIPRPGLLWDDDHVAQGFAWSEGIVSFGVPDHDGQCLIKVDVLDTIDISDSAYWVVQTPFEVASSPIKIGTIGNMKDIDVPAGSFNLVFEALPGEAEGDYTFSLNLKFIRTDKPEFKILKAGDELSTNKILRRDAQRG
ncbi:competence protein ComJ [Rhizobium sp. FKY42]|uniref:competence protein ComJ n=1 Tax=Rhizobium sp. FKY42 TaxID=2562310 RepID=UPI0010C10727|nr:competence protein ComJ [Rhizobium sp. FKY42]